MPLKNSQQLTFSSYSLQQRKTKSSFLDQIEKLIHWKPIETLLEKHYTTGQARKGRKAYPPMLLFKMILLQTWYNLSDYAVEEQVNDSLAFMKFCDLQLEDEVPDHSIVCRFRNALNKAGIWEQLLNKINHQLTKYGVLVKKGAIIDASVTPTSRKPKGKPTYELSQEQGVQKIAIGGVDQQAKWVKKGNKIQYGYKRHYLCDAKEGLVLSVHSTPANAHDSGHLGSCLEQVKLCAGSRVFADKGYCSRKNEDLLRNKGLVSGIQVKAFRNKPLSKWSKRYNTLISGYRYKIEGVFGSIKRWFGGLEARYVGLCKRHGQHILEGIAYNLYRLPGLIMSKV